MHSLRQRSLLECQTYTSHTSRGRFILSHSTKGKRGRKGGNSNTAKSFHHIRPFLAKHLPNLTSWSFAEKELLSECINLSVEEWRKINKMAFICMIALLFVQYLIRSWIAVFSPSDNRKFIGSMISYRKEKTNMKSACRPNFYQASIKLFNWRDRRTFNF